MSDQLLNPQDLLTLAEDVLLRVGVSADNAAHVARALIAAEIDGLGSHGLARLPFYADQAASGKVNGQACPAVNCKGAVVYVDADAGFAYPAIRKGLDAGIKQARQSGISAVAIANSHHFGVAGHHVEDVAARGLLALAFGNTPAAMAPWGGTTPLFGTNPIAFAAPRKEQPPLVIDLSLSKVARGKIMLADKRGERIPANWALGADGQPTTDPKSALAGSMTPLGDAKGSALALMVELLTAGLTGSNLAFEASSFFESDGDAPRVAQLFVLLDPAHFAGADVFDSRLETLSSEITQQAGTRLPGEKRLKARQAASEGVCVADPLLKELHRRAGRC